MEHSGPYVNPLHSPVSGWSNAQIASRCDSASDPFSSRPFRPGDSIVTESGGAGGKLRCYDPQELHNAIERNHGLHPVTQKPLPGAALKSIRRAMGKDAPRHATGHVKLTEDKGAGENNWGPDNRFAFVSWIERDHPEDNFIVIESNDEFPWDGNIKYHVVQGSLRSVQEMYDLAKRNPSSGKQIEWGDESRSFSQISLGRGVMKNKITVALLQYDSDGHFIRIDVFHLEDNGRRHYEKYAGNLVAS